MIQKGIRMNIRKSVFFMLDKGEFCVKKQLDEITRANNSDEYAKELHRKSIDNLISHVKATVPFYRNIATDRFEEFPVVNKVMMKDDIKSFRSNADLEIGKVRHTSGSTGIPFEIIQDKRKALRIQAELIYYREITGDEFGKKFVNLVSPSRIEKVSKMSLVKQNVIAFDVTKMDEQTLSELYNILKKNKNISYILGYTSALEKFAGFVENNKLDNKFSLKAVVSSSEILTDKSAERLRNIFNCPIYDRYSNEDNGFIAQTDGISHDFLVNRGSFYIEILKMDEDVPASENEIGRIVITDYFNYAQPFLRYDTGDLGAFSYKEVNGAKRYVLTKLAGRISDVVYGENNKPISTFAIGCALEVFSEIKQYQLVQEDSMTFTLNIIDPDKHYKNNEYMKSLKELLGNKISVNINYLNELPTLSSGKFRRVICNYKPEIK